jgi:hypothetical protein
MIVRDMAAGRERPAAQQLAVVTAALPPGVIEAVVGPYQRPEQRCRKLPLATLVLVVLGMSLYTQGAGAWATTGW